MLEDAELERILADQVGEPAASPVGEPAVQALLDAANAAGGHDNITAVLVTIVEPRRNETSRRAQEAPAGRVIRSRTSSAETSRRSKVKTRRTRADE